MSEKVKVPSLVAEALDVLVVSSGSQGILSGVLGSANTKPFLILKEYTEPHGGFSSLLKCLVNGYEVEETPEEKLKKIYGEAAHHSSLFSEGDDSGSWWRGRRDGIEIALKILNIKIEGVNA